MSDADDLARVRRQQLIDLADRIATQPIPIRRSNAPRIVVAVLMFVLGIITIVIGVRMLTSTRPATGGSGGTLPVIATTSTAPADTTPTTPSPVTTAAATVPTSAPATVTNAAGPPVRWVDVVDGVAYLRGAVPDQATADALRDAVTAALGADHVVVEYQVVPGSPPQTSDPWSFGSSIQFADESTALDPTALSALDTIVRLLEQRPQATIDIHGYTDDAGEAWWNLTLSQQRVAAIYGYLVSRGIDSHRLSATAHGEADPIADNATPEGRAANRRIVIVVYGLLTAA